MDRQLDILKAQGTALAEPQGQRADTKGEGITRHRLHHAIVCPGPHRDQRSRNRCLLEEGDHQGARREPHDTGHRIFRPRRQVTQAADVGEHDLERAVAQELGRLAPAGRMHHDWWQGEPSV